MFNINYDYDKMKNRMFTIVRDEEFLDQCAPDAAVYHAGHGLACTMHVLIRDDELKAHFTITNQLLKEANVSSEKAFYDAIDAQRKMNPPRIGELGAMLRELNHETDMSTDGVMYVVTNATGYNGASTIFYPDVKEDIANVFGGGYYILPSSIHEVLAVPDGIIPPEALLEMVKDINLKEVHPEDRMANAVYHYTPNTKAFRKVAG